jgi:tetratricopeptide (TPR) repeat protein
MLGVSRSVILSFVKEGFVSPMRGPRNSFRFGFQDVVLLRTAQTLRGAGMSAGRVAKALKRLKARLPATVPLAGLRITAVGDDIAVREAGQEVALESGQILLDFDVTPAGAVLSFPNRIVGPDASSWIAKALALEGSDPRGAMSAYSEAINLDPQNIAAQLGLGALLHEARQFDEALAVYDEALFEAPNDAELHYNRAIVLEDLGRVDDALRAYEDSIRIDPDFADAHWNVARLYEGKGVVQQALRHFNAFRRLSR